MDMGMTAKQRKRVRNQAARSKIDLNRMCTGDSGPVAVRRMTPAEYQERFGKPMPARLIERD